MNITKSRELYKVSTPTHISRAMTKMDWSGYTITNIGATSEWCQCVIMCYIQWNSFSKAQSYVNDI